MSNNERIEFELDSVERDITRLKGMISENLEYTAKSMEYDRAVPCYNITGKIAELNALYNTRRTLKNLLK